MTPDALAAAKFEAYLKEKSGLDLITVSGVYDQQSNIVTILAKAYRNVDPKAPDFFKIIQLNNQLIPNQSK